MFCRGERSCATSSPRDLEKVAEPGVIEYLERPIELRLGGHPVDLAVDLAQLGVDPSEIGFVSTSATTCSATFSCGRSPPTASRRLCERVEGGTGKTLILALNGQDRLCHLDPAACMRMSLDHLEDVLRQTTPEFFTFRPGYTNLDTSMASLLGRLRKGPLAGFVPAAGPVRALPEGVELLSRTASPRGRRPRQPQGNHPRQRRGRFRQGHGEDPLARPGSRVA